MRQINNSFYDTLHEKWHEADDHPIALLRAENKTRNPWIVKTIQDKVGSMATILDIGCGAGFLTNTLAKKGYSAYGIDLSENSLAVARAKDQTKSAVYQCARADALPFRAESFDVVCAMDLLEHVSNPQDVIKEASRVLKPGGLFFFHTFNRNFLSYLLAVKGIGWFVKNSPENLHVYSLFIKPKELASMCTAHNLKVTSWRGLNPDVSSLSFWKMIFTRKVDEKFSFVFTGSLKTGYVGYATKRP